MKLSISKSFYEFYLGYIIICTLIFYFLNSFFIKVFKFFYIENLIQPTLGLMKLIVFIFYFGLLLINFKFKNKLLTYLGLFFILFIIANINWGLKIDLDSLLFLKSHNIFYLIKYLFPFIFIGVFSLLKNKKNVISDYFEIAEKLLIINSFIVFIGFLFSVTFFKSYMHSDRFGYSGLLQPGFFGYLLVIIISRKVFYEKFDLRLLILLLTSLFIGTKSMLFFLLLLFFYYLYEKQRFKLLLIYSSFLISLLFFYKTIINFFIFLFPFWNSVLIKYGYIGLISSTRNFNIQNTLEYINIKATFKNLLIGGLDFSKCLVEMDLIDIFLFFGIIGVLLYISLISKLISKSYHLIPLIVGFFAGNFLLGTILMFTYFIWMYESHIESKELY